MRTVAKRNTEKPGPLESYPMARHCEMCGANFTTGRKGGARPIGLEPAFNPDGQPKTLCIDCRIGSAEILGDVRADLLKQLKALAIQIEASGHLIVPPGVTAAIKRAEGKV